MSLPSYPYYKDSGVDWLGKVPAHWQVDTLRRRATLNPSKTEIGDRANDELASFLPMEAVGEGGELDLSRTRPISEVSNGYTYFREGDVTFAKITPCFENGKGARMVGLHGGIGFGTTELTVIRPLPNLLDGRYLDWVLRSLPFRKRGEAAMYGAGGQKRVPDEFVREFSFAWPGLDEQNGIARFLDRETAKIDALISEQEKLLALLAEKRQATISHAVTRGLDPDAPMKDSGIPWLGKVPAHWSVGPLKHWVDLKSGGTPSKEKLQYWGGDIPWASAKDLKTEKLADTVDHITPAAVDDGAVALLPPGAVLVVVRGMILARLFPVAQTLVPMAINQDLKGVLPRAGLDAGFLAWLLRGTAKESLQRLDEAGHGTKALRMEAWTSMALPIPPETEQAQIVAFLVQRTNQLDVLGYEASSAIELLRERRSALIAAAVTGQIDVRNLVEVQAA